MTSLTTVLASIPDALRNPLLEEYNNIIQNYLERKWAVSELSGGRFAEIVYCILLGHSTSSYPAAPYKPANMRDDCFKLERNTHVPRSFQILIPRLLPVLYEIRNNRNVGHVGGDVDSNNMDALAVVSMSSWVLGELIRVFHNVSITEAQSIVDFITNRKIPLVWESGTTKRILDPTLALKDQIILLVGSQATKVKVVELQDWLEVKSTVDRKYFMKTLRGLHSSRLTNISNDGTEVEMLPPGSAYLEGLVAKHKDKKPTPPKKARRRR